MKKILCMLALIATQNVFAQQVSDISIDNVKAFADGKQMELGFVPCEKKTCSISSSRTMDYLVAITTMNGKSLKNMDQQSMKIDVKILSEEDRSILEVTYTENLQSGLFNEDNTIAISHGKSKKINYSAVYYVPVNDKDKSYKVTVKDKIDVVVKLN